MFGDQDVLQKQGNEENVIKINNKNINFLIILLFYHLFIAFNVNKSLNIFVKSKNNEIIFLR